MAAISTAGRGMQAHFRPGTIGISTPLSSSITSPLSFYWAAGMAGQRRVDGCGVNFAAMFRRAAAFVDKILKGTKPSDISVDQATKFASVINLKTAGALGLDAPDTARAQG